jgi:hypothetical protein
MGSPVKFVYFIDHKTLVKNIKPAQYRYQELKENSIKDFFVLFLYGFTSKVCLFDKAQDFGTDGQSQPQHRY